jgi:quercetin dioxygenase-like cupin family protein
MTTLNLTPSQLPSAKPYVALESEARWYGNSLWEFLVPNEATAGKLTVFEATMPGGFSPPRHIHTREDEVFLVQDGEVCFDVDGELTSLRAVPPSTCHAAPRIRSAFRARSHGCSAS